MPAGEFQCVWTLRMTSTVAVARWTAEDGVAEAIPVILDDELLNPLHVRFIAADPRGIIVSSAFLLLPRGQREAAIWQQVAQLRFNHHDKADEFAAAIAGR